MSAITKEKVKAWIIAAAIRAVRTISQTALALVPVGATIAEVSWATVASTALLAGFLSVLTSLAGLPEVSDGETLPSIMTTVEGEHIKED